MSSRWAWRLVALLVAVDAAGLYLLVNSYRADAAKAERLEAERVRLAEVEAAKPKPPPPPAMIHPLPVTTALQSGTLVVISKQSQHMYVFNEGLLWASTPVSTGKRRHETPTGVFPILQKRKFHRSNIYSNAPMPFMQRLTWGGIALHAGRVPGYAASHGCVRMPHGFAEALFKLTDMKATTVVIGNDPIEDGFQAQQFAMYRAADLPIRAALAPPSDPPPVFQLALAAAVQMQKIFAGSAATAAPAPVPPIAPVTPTETRLATAYQPSKQALSTSMAGQTIQLTAAASPAEAEAYWARLHAQRPDISRFQKSVEPAQVNARKVYRLRLSGTDAYVFCAKLKSEGISCLNVI